MHSSLSFSEKITFLHRVFRCSIQAFGGPVAHYGVFAKVLVDKHKYLSNQKYQELIALANLLPGPSSTQTITIIGYYLGGLGLALATFIVWAIPALIIMAILGALWKFGGYDLSQYVSYVPVVVAVFMFLASLKLTKKNVNQSRDLGFLVGGFCLVWLNLAYGLYPLVMLTGGLVYYYLQHKIGESSQVLHKLENLNNVKELKNQEPQPPTRSSKKKLSWYLVGFIGIFGVFWWGLNFGEAQSKSLSLMLFTKFFNYGTIVVGGGDVVIPAMYQDLVTHQQLLTDQEFMLGYSLAQFVPGPMFSVASFFASVILNAELASLTTLAQAAIIGAGLFIPGIVLIILGYPLYNLGKDSLLLKAILRGASLVLTGAFLATSIKILLFTNLSWLSLILAGFLVLLTRGSLAIPVVIVIALRVLGL